MREYSIRRYPYYRGILKQFYAKTNPLRKSEHKADEPRTY